MNQFAFKLLPNVKN